MSADATPHWTLAVCCDGDIYGPDCEGCPNASSVAVVPASALDDLRAENESLQAQLRGGKAAFKELAYTAEALRGDRVRALESDRHRIRADDLEAERDAAVRERDHYREALERADWLITCLRSVTRRVPVRNLDEAEEGWRIARAALAVPAPPTKEENDA